MTDEKKNRMFEAAKFLAKQHQEDQLCYDDRQLFYHFGQTAASFVLGARWSEKEDSWVSITDRMPEDSLPVLSNPQKTIKNPIKVMVCMKSGQVMQATRRCSLDGVWYFNIPLCMRDQITHWMPIPPVPEEIRNENNK